MLRLLAIKWLFSVSVFLAVRNVGQAQLAFVWTGCLMIVTI